MIRGVLLVVSSIKTLARSPSLWLWVAVPFALCFTGVFFGWRFVWQGLVHFTDSGLSYLPAGVESVVGPVARWTLGLTLAVLGYFVAVSLATAITGPFCEKISEVTERRFLAANKQSATSASGDSFVFESVRGLTHSVRRLLKYAAMIFLLFVMGLVVPVLGPIVFSGLGFLLTAKMVAFDSFDAVLARKQYTYAAKRRYLRNNPQALGIGIGVAVLLMIPLVGLLAPSIGAIAATQLYCQKQVAS